MPDRQQTERLFSWPGREALHVPAGSLCVIGAPTDKGNAISRGAALAPSAIRRASLHCMPPKAKGVDWGDVEDDAADLEAYLDRLNHCVENILGHNLCPLILGGDHSITFAPLSKISEQRDICLIWFDAHTDFSPWHGPGAHTHKQVLRRISALDGVKNIIQIGHRGITTGDERNLGAKSRVITSRMAETLDETAFTSLIPEQATCYISIDIDVIDPRWVPGTSAPVPDGLSPTDIAQMLMWIIRNRHIAALDLVEVNPRQDLASASSRVAAALLHGIAENWASRIGQPKTQPDMREARLFITS